MNTENENTPPATDKPKSVKPARADDFRLFKRSDNTDLPERSRPYYFRFQFRGKNYTRCLETNDATLAQSVARQKATEIKEAIIRGDLDTIKNKLLRQPTVATVDQLLAVYDKCSADASITTRHHNKREFKIMLREVHGTTEPGTLPLNQINATTSRRWFELANKKLETEKDQERQLSIKRTANSYMAKAVSIFVPKAVASYKDSGIHLPCLDEFHDAFESFKFSRLPKSSPDIPSDDLVATTMEAWQKIEDRNLFLTIGHELAFGLRAGEMSQAKWGWWTVRGGYPCIDGQATVKNGTAFVQVRALDPWFNQIRARVEAEGWRGQPDDYIIEGAARNDGIFRAVGHWLKALGWETKKTNHALRAYAGSQIAMKYGIHEAQIWLRHSTVKVTEDHYSYFIKRFKPANVDSIPATWATVQTAPQITIFKPAVNQ